MAYQVGAAVVNNHTNPSNFFASSFCVDLIHVIVITIGIIPYAVYAVEKLNILHGTKMLSVEAENDFGDCQEQTKFAVSSAIDVVTVS